MAEPPLEFLARLFGSRPAPEPDMPPPLARGLLPSPATGMELPPLARGRMPPLMALGDVAGPQDLSAQRMASQVPMLPPRTQPAMEAILGAQDTGGAPPWSTTSQPWLEQSFPRADPERLMYRGTDPEGRSIGSLFHAGTLAGGVNKPLGPVETQNLASALTAVQDPEGLVASNLRFPRRPLPGGMLGNMYSSEKLLSPEAAIGLEVDARSPDRRDVLRHETGHALHRRMLPEGRNLEDWDATLGLAQGFTGDKAAAIQQMKDASYAVHRAGMAQGGAPEDDIRSITSYSQMPSELVAESFRAYTADPAGFKRQYPEAAALMRAIVNTNPRTNKLMTLSRADDDERIG
jgi:hypothetical protein